MTDVIDSETAENEFNRWSESMDLDIDPELMDDDDKKAFKKQKRRLIKAICNGSLIVNDDGEFVYTPQKSKNTDSLTFHERTGASVMAMDGKKKNHNVAQTYAIMADMTRGHPGVFAKMIGEDIKICEAIFILLMD